MTLDWVKSAQYDGKIQLIKLQVSKLDLFKLKVCASKKNFKILKRQTPAGKIYLQTLYLINDLYEDP